MRTITLFTALLLLALQAQAVTLQETADQLPSLDQPEAKDQDELWAEDQDQDVAITFTGEERLAREASSPWKLTPCTCRRSLFCKWSERHSGSCKIDGRRHRLCCK